MKLGIGSDVSPTKLWKILPSLTCQTKVLHTFQGGCSSSFDPYVMEEGDGVDDTPFMGLWDPNSCDRTRDSCGEDGLDPVENYMDYSAEYAPCFLCCFHRLR